MPTPELTPQPGVRVDGDWLVWEMRDPSAPLMEPEPVSLPEDFYLRELTALDPDDLDAVADWCRAYGWFCGAGGGLDLGNWSVEAEDEITELADREHPEAGFLSMHKDLVKVYVREAQEAITTWLACRHEGGLDALVEADVNTDELTRLQAENSHRDDGWPQNLEQVREFLLWSRLSQLRGALDAALKVFSIGIGSLTDRHPTIYSVAFLQLYNHLAENAVIRTCANETCGQSFVRQRGRAEYGQHRTSGIKYCARECARAQAQREHRRRKRNTTPAQRAAPPRAQDRDTPRGPAEDQTS